MKGLVVNNKKWVLRDDLPIPLAEHNEVLIKVKSASVNPYDIESAQGRFDDYFTHYGVNKAVQTGLEFSGIIESDGKKFKRGDHVFGYVHMITGWKTHAEYIAVNEDYIALIPTALSFCEAAALPLGALTTLIALEDIAQIKTGMKLLINGASGGLGVHAIQIGNLLGGEITAIAGNSQDTFLHSYGATHVYDYNKVDINDLSDTFDIILDLTNQQTLDDMKKRLRPNGIFIPAEPNQNNGDGKPDPQLGHLMVMHGDNNKLTRIANWVSEGKIKSVVDTEFHFSQYHQALARLQEKGRQGRIVMNW